MWIKKMLAFFLVLISLFSLAQPTFADSSDSYIACYFYNASNDDTTWEWALTKSNDYYKINGSWRTTEYTKLEKFFPSNSVNVSYGDICAACDNAKAHKQLGDSYNFLAFFAATSGLGSNYPVVLNGTDFFPDL
ncbi:MAG: hypothetical protein F6K18_09625 [Okeania sp. SIO2C2]|uniref:hypothetical protein n=1 Tax=Okeania sp. SIO2C2 TaxID=2607787 RepID=UPI0013B5D959|nr:hypothetical protein [Okeania sp. SIO2C2]NEP87070.1 hypothetical protein [Okeania sp. SIO2C2]